MSRKLLSILFLLAVLCAAAAAQSVAITPKKVVYRRPRPMSEFKRTFTVTYPVVKAATPALSRKIEATISYKTVMQLDVREEINEVQWLEEAGYTIDYNARGILSITLSISGTGAYPDGSSKTVVANLSNGERVTAADAFVNTDALVDLIREKQKAEIKSAIDEIKKDPDLGEADPAELFSEEQFTLEDLNEFRVDAKGVTFIHDYGFPHVIQALEPEGLYSFSWRELERFVKPAGPFAAFVSK